MQIQTRGLRHNPLKRVKFISILVFTRLSGLTRAALSQSPQTGQVYFNRNPVFLGRFSHYGWCHNPLKRVKFISMLAFNATPETSRRSQSPQTGQVYFNTSRSNPDEKIVDIVTIPSNGSSLFQSGLSFAIKQIALKSHNPLKRVKFISIFGDLSLYAATDLMSQSPQTGQVYFNL